MKRLLTLAMLLASCASDPGSASRATVATGHIYVMSAQNAHPFVPGDTWGSDANDCESKSSPCETLVAAVSKAEAMAEYADAVQIHMGGWSAPGSIGTADDPWDGYPTQPRAYLAPVLPLHSGRATRNTFSYVGPRKMFATAAAPVGYLGAVTVVPGRVLLRFTAHQLAYGSSGLFLRFTEGAGGRDLFFPHVISEVTAAGLIIDTTYTAADWDAYVWGKSGTFEVCEPAAQIVGSFAEQSYPVIVRGDLPPDVGDGLDNGQATDTNPVPAIAYATVFQPRFIWTGTLYLAAVWTDIEARYLGPGPARMRSVTSAPNGLTVYMASARVRGNDSWPDAQHERSGWAAVPVAYGVSPPADADPYSQFGGPIDLTLSGGPLYIGGRGEAQGPALFRAVHGLSVYYPGGQPVTVLGPAAMLDMEPGARLWMSGGGLWARDGAGARLDVAAGVTGSVTVGRGDAVTLGAGQRIDGDDNSAVWDRAWESN